MSSLQLSYEEFRSRIGDYRGYGPDTSKWSDKAVTLTEDILKSGCQKVYFGANHEWSFLTATKTLTIPSGVDEFDLPLDFGQLANPTIHFSGTNTTAAAKLVDVGEAKILHLRQRDTSTTGVPTHVAIVTRSRPGISDPQRQKMLIWPETNDAYIVKIRCSLVPLPLGPANPYHYGGAPMSQVFLESFLSTSEEKDGMPGFYTQKYPQTLSTAIMYDMRSKPRRLGRKSDVEDDGPPAIDDFIAVYNP